MASPPSKPSRGNLALAFVGYFGVIASAVSGFSRWFVIGFASFGFLGYLLSASNLYNYLVNHYLVHRYKTHWNCRIINTSSSHGAGALCRIFFGASEKRQPPTIPENVEALVNSRGFRCELRRPWHLKRYPCSAPAAIPGSAYIQTAIPEELLVLNPTRSGLVLVGGPYVIRWKKDKRWKSIARSYIGVGDHGALQEHFVRRAYNGWIRLKSKLNDQEKWPTMDDPTP
jgi:hypothetical protein